MITVKLENLYKKPYYSICKNGKTMYAYGFEQVIGLLERIKKKREKIKLDDSVLQEHSKLIGLLYSDKFKRRMKR